MIQENPLQQRLDEELARFKVLAEYGYSGSYQTPTTTPAVLGEADDDEEQDGNAPANVPGGAEQGEPAGQGSTPEPGAPQGQEGIEQPQGEEPAGGDVPPVGPEGDAGVGDMDSDGAVPPMPGEGGGVSPDDTVIDVDDLTKAQEDINNKVNTIGSNVADVNAALTKLIDRIDAIDTRLDDNSSDIKDFYRELVKRNPTEVEKLQLRYKDSFPFNVSPDDYFEGKDTKPLVPGQTEHVEEDEEGRKKINGQYVITKQDVADGINSAEVANSFSFDENMCRSMKSICEAVNSFEVAKTEEEVKEEEILNQLKGKMIVYHFGNCSGTLGIRVGYAKILNSERNNILLTDEDGNRSIVINDVEGLIHHAIPSPHASFYVGNTLRDGDGFAVMP